MRSTNRLRLWSDLIKCFTYDTLIRPDEISTKARRKLKGIVFVQQVSSSNTIDVPGCGGPACFTFEASNYHSPSLQQTHLLAPLSCDQLRALQLIARYTVPLSTVTNFLEVGKKVGGVFFPAHSSIAISTSVGFEWCGCRQYDDDGNRQVTVL